MAHFGPNRVRFRAATQETILGSALIFKLNSPWTSHARQMSLSSSATKLAAFGQVVDPPYYLIGPTCARPSTWLGSQLPKPTRSDEH
jgi:hypothetical protein